MDDTDRATTKELTQNATRVMQTSTKVLSNRVVVQILSNQGKKIARIFGP
ncbi:unnamed protein product [Arabidopsis thaliana]|uniref:Uncharacterized protein n=1 Tax=Arabidopsis thaliana TaxID=3702 RepID=Q9LJS3_ARATH|nr:unnamed protein product [Arabidopsis thaliana]